MNRTKLYAGVVAGLVAVGSLAWAKQEAGSASVEPSANLTGASCAPDPWSRIPALASGQVIQARPQGAPPEMIFIVQCWNGTLQTVASFRAY